MVKLFLRAAAFVLVALTSAGALAQTPTATTTAATSLTTSSAVLNGTGTPAGETATGSFELGTINPGTCNSTFGTPIPGTGGTDLGSGTVAVSYSITATGLVSGVTYYFCAIVSNASGTAYGSVLSFTIPGAPTSTTTDAATSVTSTGAILNGSADPTGATTTGSFRYATTNPTTCNTTFGTAAPASGGAALGSGSSAVAYNETLTGLSPGTTYYFCAIATNAEGTGLGSVLSFTTPAVAPTVTTNGATSVAGTTAQLNGSGTPGGADTTAWFRYSTTNPGTCNNTFGTAVPATGGTDLGSGNAAVSFSQPLTGLTDATTYYYCALASNSVGTSLGSILSFTTLQPPTVTTYSSSGLTNTSATLTGYATPNGDTTIGWFEYATTNPGTCNNSFGSSAPTSGGVSLGTGTSSMEFQETITGLSPATTYYFCALASNPEGLSVGTVLSFTTLSAPTAATAAATAITSSSATLNGSTNPDGASTTAWFRYATTNPGSCTTSFGTLVPSTGIAAGAGYSAVALTEGITGLTPSTTYYYCAYATNAYGTALGALESFETTAALPTVSTTGASAVSGTTATLNGSANPGGADTTGWFRYAAASPGTCNNTFGTAAPATGGTDLGSGISAVSYSQAIMGLTPNTTYYYCALASNSVGLAVGTVLSFTTPIAPTVTTTMASSITNTTAYLYGTANPNNATTTGWFQYGTTNPGTCTAAFGTFVPATGGASLGAGTSAVSYDEPVTGLTAGTTYYYCAAASNSQGTSYGAVLSFTTLAPPTVTTLGASSLTSSTATLNGSGIPNGADTTAWFEYSTTNPGNCSASFGTRVPASGGTDLSTGTSAVAFSDGITGLAPVTTYYVCAMASNAYGTAGGSVVSFTTTAAAPVVETNGATSTTETTATLNGYTNPEGADTTGWFQYSTTNPGTCNNSFGTPVPASGGTDLGSGTAYVSYSQTVTGLTANTTYYFCAISSNSVGLSYGAIESFTTPLPPTVTTVAASSITNTTATLNGTGIPNNAATTGWFRYAATSPGTCNNTFGSLAPATGSVSLGSGTTSEAFAESISGLSAGTTYYFCAIASNTQGTSFGTVLSFKTAAPPVVTTDPATSVTSSTAVLNGAGVPNGADTTGWFGYSTTNLGTCSSTFGTRVPSSGGTDLSTGTSAVSYAQSLTGLTPSTTYYVCAIADNAYGTAWGAPVSFTTTAATPTVTTEAASSLTGTTAQLNGYANPGGADTTAWFRYATVSPGTCNNTFGTQAPATGGTDLGAGTGTVSFDQAITGLTAGTTYYYCAIASNSVSMVFGSVVTFTTPVPPTVTTTSASSITNTYAYLYGTANPNSGTTTGWFQYGTTNPGTCSTTFGTSVPATGGASLGAGTSAVSYDEYLSGLSAGTTYYFCAVASNAAGTSVGAVLSFTTATAPVLTTAAATSITSSSAILNGAGTPNGADTVGWFGYSTTNPGTCSAMFGTRLPSSGGTDLSTGTSAVAYSDSLTGLTPSTTYYYCAIGDNAYGTVWGSVLSFTTLAAAPTVTTSGASNLTGTTAQLNGYGNPNGADTTAWFRYATTSPGTCNNTFGTAAPATGGTDLGPGISTVTFSQTITGLTAGTTYYYCALVSNSVGSAVGAVSSFTTPLPPTVVTSPAESITNTSAYLYGSAVPNNAATTAWFRYDITNPGTCNGTFGSSAPTSGGTSVGSGTTSVAYDDAITGLSPATTYYFCAIASSSQGTSYGAVLTFTTQAASTVTTDAATMVTSSSAVLNGSGVPNGADTTGWFEYSTTFPGNCSTTFGIRAPASGGTDLSTGTSSVSFSQTITALTPNTTYYYCAIDENEWGTALGAVGSFVTAAAAPSVTTEGATNLTATTATLNGAANPGGADTTAWFRYDTESPGTCNNSFGTPVPATGGTDLGAGNGVVSFSQAVSGLTAGTTYYFCALASNSAGLSVGAVVTLTTPLPPSVTTLAATPITATTATLNGYGNGNGYTTTGWLRYSTSNPGSCSDSFGTRVPSTGGVSLGTSGTSYSEPLTSLTPGTLYYFCAIASSGVGTGFGSVLTFTTASTQPTVTTVAASGIASGAATLNGAAIPNGNDTTGWFRYATTSPGTCNNTFGTPVPATGGTDLGPGTASVPWSQTLTGLTNGTTYYFCAIASNGIGTSYGAVLTFNTAEPTVTTAAATSVTSTGATLNGAANPNGTATTGSFEYATTNPGTCSTSFGTSAPATGGASLGAGTAAASYSQPVTGLSPSTTYYYCAIASSAAGTGFGTIVSFTTAGPPVVATSPTTLVTSTGATLNGAANPDGADTSGWFGYSTTNPGTCTATFGTRVPATGGTDLGSGTSSATYSQTITGLTPGTTYYVCAIASNAYGTAEGSVVTFNTPAGAPTVSTVGGTPLTGTTAQLNGSADPDGADTLGWFRYDTSNPGTCDNVFGTPAPATGGTDLGAGNSTATFDQTISGLLPGTTYYFCAIASNSAGTVFGTIASFTTPELPAITTSAASAVTSTTATLNGSGIPDGLATTGWFRYGTTNPGTCSDSFGTRAPATGGTALGMGASAVSFSQAITGLAPLTTYYFCAIGSSTAGEDDGTVLSFTTSGPPAVTTSAATSLSTTGATLNGSAIANGADTTAWFRYATTNPGICSNTFGTPVPATGGTDLGSGSTGVAFTQSLTGLVPGATYYFCALASNTYGTSTGMVLSFTLPAALPAVTTVSGTPLSGTTAQLDGSANPDGADTTAWFRYDTSTPGTCDDVFGTRAPATGGTDLGSGNSVQTFSEMISGLVPGTTYYLCAIASNASGTSFGAVLTFTAPTTPAVVTSAASAVASNSATLNGSATPDGAATAGWFQYGTTNPGTCSTTFGTQAPASGGTPLGTGSSAVPFSQPITGLTPNTTYYFCAVASNAGGTATGTVLSFTTTATPGVTEQPATQVTTTSATLNGSANPNGADSTGWFRYDVTNPGICSDSFGTRVPASSGTDLGSGTSAVAYTQALSGLTPGTTYYSCALASNASGTGTSPVVTFTTPPLLPTVTTVDANPLTGTTAQLDGSATPGGGDTTGWFRYDVTNPGTCDDAFGTRAPATGGTDLGSGTTAQTFSQMLTGLTPGTTYYACAIASNASGTAFGAVLSFTAPLPPTVVTSAATAIMSASATLNGSANPSGTATTGWFRYDVTNPGTCNDTFGTAVPASGGTSLGAGSTAVAFSQPITGLSVSTTYYFCALASNTGGMATGTVLSFTTSAVPAVTTLPAAQVTLSSATLNGTANPNGEATTGWFRYGTTSPASCNDTFGVRAPTTSGTALGAGSTAASYTQALTGLTPGTTYYYCAIASNSAGKGFGTVTSFSTPAPTTPPAVTTEAATAVSSSGATMNGTANPNLAATTGWFRFSTTDPGSCDDMFGTRVPATGGTQLGAGGSPVAYAETMTGLAPATTYYFCAIASNASGTSFGDVLSWTSPAIPPTVTTLPPADVQIDMATLNGTANPNGSDATGWFRYDTTNPSTCNDSFGTRTPATGGTDLGSGMTVSAYAATITDLVPGTTYYFCAIASNSAGTSFGTVVTFSPGEIAPVVTTDAATALMGTGATLVGTVNPNALAAIGWFQYSDTQPTSCNDSFGQRVPATGGSDIAAGTTPVAFMQALTGLTPNTTYYYCAAASNQGGAAFGGIRSFTTTGVAPVVTTGIPTLTGTGDVTLNGMVNPGGEATTAWFRIGNENPGTCTDSFGTRTPSTGGISLTAGLSPVPFTESLTGLSPGKYYVCAIASNAAGMGVGGALSISVPTPATTAKPGGCACRAGGAGSDTVLWLLPLVLLAAPRRRRVA